MRLRQGGAEGSRRRRCSSPVTRTEQAPADRVDRSHCAMVGGGRCVIGERRTFSDCRRPCPWRVTSSSHRSFACFAAMPSQHAATRSRTLLNKVPEVTLWFWLIKVLCTTVGETAADFLNADLGFGLTGTSILTGLLLAIVLALQMRSGAYVPGLYWATVTLVSVFGTLVTDNLTDNL